MPLRNFNVQNVSLEVDSRMLNDPLVAALERGRYEGEEARALKALLKPQDSYFELGGGLGFISTLASRVVTDPERLHVYEANPELIPVIERTWAVNGVSGRLHHCMLGTGKGEHEFHVSKAFWASSGHISYGTGRTITVPQRDFLKQLSKWGATFVMMDIEGGERDLLDKPLPEHVRTVVAEYHPKIIGEEVVAGLFRCLEGQGFRVAAEVSDAKVRAYVR
jgi:FkbM family methyltransferase